MSEYIKNLNQAQKDAVVNFKSPSLIVAGAGSGKTRVLTCRIAYMLEKGIAPHKILSLTFTNKAAAEMRERIGTLVSEQKSKWIWMGTFHSIFARILRAEADRLGYPATFTIYDSQDSRNVIKGILKEMSLSDETYKPNVIQSRISLAKNNLVTPQAYEANTQLIATDRENKVPQLVEVYKAYARKCKENGAMDFDDLLLNINILFRDHADVLEKYQKRFDYILVDEYQDTNYAQYIIIRRLAQHHSNVCVVGDDAQSIYSFRGAKIENILRFKNDFPGANIFKLEQNYRSTKTIVEAANSVIEKNQKQIKKESFSDGDKGEAIKVFKAYTDQEEASIVADGIRDAVRSNGADWNEVALLYRTNMQSRVMEEALRRRSIPYKIYGGTSFYQRKEVKDLIAYIRLVINPKDDEAFKRIINYPARGLGDVTLNKIATAAQARNISMWDAVSTVDGAEMELRGAAVKKVADFVEMIKSLSLAQQQMGLYEIGHEIAIRSGIIGIYKMDPSPESQSALENIEELLNSMQLFSEQDIMIEQYDETSGELLEGLSVKPTLEVWLQNVALITDMDNEKAEDKNKVTLMTVHSAKGLEFRYVFIVGLEENLFPSLMSMGTPEGLEEERRLFYVALTRAKEAAVLSFSETRFKWGSTEFCKPSRFLSEIDPKYLDINFDLEDTRMESDKASDPRENNRRFSDDSVQRGESGHVVRGDSARKWASPNPYRKTNLTKKEGTTVAANKPKLETIHIPQPAVGAGTRFKSVGTRLAESAQPTGEVYSGEYSEGMAVIHSKFGRGKIVTVEQMSSDTKITIDFEGNDDFGKVYGKKTLLGKFAKLRVL